jgi:phosphatidate cytidylyltransferase
LLIGAAVLSAVFFLPSFSWFIPVILIGIVTVATLEFYALLDAIRLPHFKVFGTLGGGVLVLATWCGIRFGASGVEWESFVVFGITLFLLLRLFPQKDNHAPIETIAGTFLGLIYIPFLLNFITKSLTIWGSQDGRWFVIYMIVVVKFSDIGAYFVGCAIGKHKLLPRLSPAKTWEGFLGGLLTATSMSVLFWFFSHGSLGVVRFSFFDAVCMAMLITVAGLAGDLTESLFKRAAGVKDSSRLIQGMGGILDVIDSILFAAPVAYIYARLFLERLP